MGIILDCCIFDKHNEDLKKNIKEEELESIILHVEPNYEYIEYDEYQYEKLNVVL